MSRADAPPRPRPAPRADPEGAVVFLGRGRGEAGDADSREGPRRARLPRSARSPAASAGTDEHRVPPQEADAGQTQRGHGEGREGENHADPEHDEQGDERGPGAGHRGIIACALGGPGI